MRSRDVRATTAGLLFITATATSLITTAILGSLLDGPGFLAAVSLHQDRMLTAALFQLIAAFTCAAIAVTLYPVLERACRRDGARSSRLPAHRGRVLRLVSGGHDDLGQLVRPAHGQRLRERIG